MPVDAQFKCPFPGGLLCPRGHTQCFKRCLEDQVRGNGNDNNPAGIVLKLLLSCISEGHDDDGNNDVDDNDDNDNDDDPTKN